MMTKCGTPEYQAPEILQPQMTGAGGAGAAKQSGYSNAVDLWSLGVILYSCLCGFPPFSDSIDWHSKKYTLSEQILKGLFKFPSPYWDKMSGESKDLITHLLEVDAMKRITAADALEHAWLAETRPTAPYVGRAASLCRARCASRGPFLCARPSLRLHTELANLNIRAVQPPLRAPQRNY